MNKKTTIQRHNNFNIILTAQLLALNAVENPTYDVFLDRIRRWYAKNFLVPLTKVYQINDLKLLTVWFEEFFLGLRQNGSLEALEDYHKIKKDILAKYYHLNPPEDDLDSSEKVYEFLKNIQKNPKSPTNTTNELNVDTQSTQDQSIKLNTQTQNVEPGQVFDNLNEVNYINFNEFDDANT